MVVAAAALLALITAATMTVTTMTTMTVTTVGVTMAMTMTVTTVTMTMTVTTVTMTMTTMTVTTVGVTVAMTMTVAVADGSRGVKHGESMSHRSNHDGVHFLPTRHRVRATRQAHQRVGRLHAQESARALHPRALRHKLASIESNHSTATQPSHRHVADAAFNNTMLPPTGDTLAALDPGAWIAAR